ncbi:MAG: nuclear transport factor 2 family protein [Pseudomonadota bacterium]
MNEDIQALLDKQAITEVLYRYCRGLDRMDKPLSLSCWHPGGTDDHAPLFKGTAEGFLDWLWPVHAAMEATRHVVSNITIELAGDKAATECYWNLHLRIPQGDKVYDLIGEGRYLDNFEKIDGVWAIRHRASVGDMMQVYEKQLDMTEISPPLIMPNNLEAASVNWARDPSDYSYELFASLQSSN